ncbi:uncharacterized protein [Onthophagus taurus]|uniref:uncharacterized protein isoform X3 n=1 Tax=Onthophagus taurus TaxID=166361 RepID=UPI000C20E24D|nr:uncharacterized protein LOC111427525 isoform X3 [Onthophagus taurus]
MRGSTAGIAENFKIGGTAYHLLLSVMDSIFSAVVVAPLVVGYWRSVWELMNIYVYPDDKLLSALISTIIGICGHLFFDIAQGFFTKRFHPDKNRIIYYVVSRAYTVAFAFVCVNGWKGPWNLLDQYTDPKDLTVVVVPFVIGIIALAVLRTLRNVSAPPFAIATDHVEEYFVVMTMFRIKMAEKTTLYVLDCIFSVLVVGTLVVFVWRGAWVLLDDFLFPESASLSAWCSLVIGYLAVGLAFLLQPVMRWVCDRLQGGLRLIAADIFLLFSLFGTVNVWRGIWTLLNLYFLPDNQEISCWITHWICLILLVLLGCSNSLLVRGVYIDAEEPAGKCVIFPCYYLRLIFQQERAKKIAKRLQLDILAKRKQDIDNNIADINHMVHEKQPNNHVV